MKNIPFLAIFLLACLNVAHGQSSPASGMAGIEGTISISPVHGGPTREGVADSAPLANIAFQVKRDGQVVKSFQTDGSGRFQIALEPGHYIVSRKDWKAAVGSYGPFEVDVEPGKMTTVAWKCDSGMR